MKFLINTAILFFVFMFSATAARSQLIPINCSGSTGGAGSVSCSGSGSGYQYQTGRAITGFVQIATSNVSYNSGTGQFTFNATVQNLISQSLGTSNGTTTDPSGVRVFFHSGPTVTGGTGVVSVIPDGFGTFTAAGQPYYQYNQILAPMQVTPAHTFTLIMPPTVTTFSFQLLVEAAVQFAPTAAGVSVSGRVLTSTGGTISRATVLISDSQGNTRSTRTNSFGYFRFEDVEAGQTYVFNISAKGHTFVPQVVSVSDDIAELNFTALE